MVATTDLAILSFEIVTVSLHISTGKIFYLLNFTYIGTCIALGISMMVHKKKYATECILCAKCIHDCPKNALRLKK